MKHQFTLSRLAGIRSGDGLCVVAGLRSVSTTGLLTFDGRLYRAAYVYNCEENPVLHHVYRIVP